MTFEVDEYSRYVIARFFRPVDEKKTRTRATRKQVRRFIGAALNSAVNEQRVILDPKGRATAKRLRDPKAQTETLPEPPEKQTSIRWT